MPLILVKVLGRTLTHRVPEDAKAFVQNQPNTLYDWSTESHGI